MREESVDWVLCGAVRGRGSVVSVGRSVGFCKSVVGCCEKGRYLRVSEDEDEETRRSGS